MRCLFLRIINRFFVIYIFCLDFHRRVFIAVVSVAEICYGNEKKDMAIKKISLSCLVKQSCFIAVARYFISVTCVFIAMVWLGKEKSFVTCGSGNTDYWQYKTRQVNSRLFLSGLSLDLMSFLLYSQLQKDVFMLTLQNDATFGTISHVNTLTHASSFNLVMSLRSTA